MTLSGWILILVFTAAFVALAKPMGAALFALYGDKPLPLARIENGLYRLAGVNPKSEQGWAGYAWAVVIFNLVGIASLFALFKLQGSLPLNPRALPRSRPGSRSTPRSVSSPTPTGRITPVKRRCPTSPRWLG